MDENNGFLYVLSCLFSIQGLDGSSEISGLLSNVQDIEVLTEHVINVVQAKMREQNSIRVGEI